MGQYTHTTWAALKAILAQRLGDASKVFWVDAECAIYLSESLRTYGILAAPWRERGVVSLQPSTAFYDLTTALSNSLLTSTVTDRDIIQQLQYMLCESTSTQSSWPGTSQFTYSDVVNAITQYRNQFLADTGIICTRSTMPVNSPPIGRQPLDEDVIDVRRAAWVGSSPTDYYTLLWREDERALTLADQQWSTSSGTPAAYSIMAPPPLQMQLAPPPMSSGSLDLITINNGPALNPAASATPLGIPDDLTPAIKWGALGYLLAIDGQARDSSRAAFASARYSQYVQLARLLSAVVHVEINGVPTIPDTLYGLDAGVVDWQNETGTPNYIGLAGWNLFAAYPVPDSLAPYSATFDVVCKAPIPIDDTAYVQVGQDQLDAILEYAVHLALFKCGGMEFAVTQRLADEFMLQAMTYNQRLSAAARYVIAPKESSQREKAYRSRRSQSEGLGSLPSIQEAQSFTKTNAPSRVRNNA